MSVNVVAVFVILGALVGIGEGGNAFMSISTKLAGKLRGGGAKVSVLASAFFGSISGSSLGTMLPLQEHLLFLL